MNVRRHAFLLLSLILLALGLEAAYAQTLPHPLSFEKQENQAVDEPPQIYFIKSVRQGSQPLVSYVLDRVEGIEKTFAKIVDAFNRVLRAARFFMLPATMGVAAPLEVVENNPRQPNVQFFEPDGYPPEPWSRLKEETRTEYVYETAWGLYHISKTLPVFRYFSHEEGFCRQWSDAADGTTDCVDFYSNRPYNTTSGFWLLVDGSPGLPAGYTVWRAGDDVFVGEARVVRGLSVYSMKVSWNFTVSRTGPKIAVEVVKVSGADRVFRVIWFGLARGVVDAVGVDVNALGGVDVPLGSRDRLRLSFSTETPDRWRQYLEIDWRDEGPADTWLANINILGFSFYGWLTRFRENDAFIDPSAQVFGPNTVDPGFNSTGEKTLLTMNTTLPAGGKNVIIAVFKPSSVETSAWGRLTIKKGATYLFQSYLASYVSLGGMRAKPVMLLAVDSSPTGNDTYTFVFSITSAGSTTTAVHVQGAVIKADDAEWMYNSSAVSIAAGATATVVNLTTNYPANSKVVILAYVYASRASGSGDALLGAGNIKIKLGGNVVSSNQFNQGSYQNREPAQINLAWLGTLTSSTQSWSVEVTNASSVAFNAYAILVVFSVDNGAFLDTGSVALTQNAQTTVGNLTTSLTGDVVVIALAAAENTGSSAATAFNADGVVLQLNNSTTGQISNLVEWFLTDNTTNGRSGILPLLRFYTNVVNPSYQVKMTPAVANIKGEAKIVAFTMPAGQSFTVNLAETVAASDAVSRVPNYVRILAETLTALDTVARVQALTRTMSETLTASDILSRVVNYVRVISEAAGASDSLSRLYAGFRTFSETVAVSDTISRSFNFVRNLSETLTASDSVTRTAAYIRTLSEMLGVTSTLFPGAAVINILEMVLISEGLQVMRMPAGSQQPQQPPPIQIPAPTAQQVLPVGLAIALGIVFAGATAAVSRRRTMSAAVSREIRRPSYKGMKLARPSFKGIKLRRKWVRKGLPRPRRHRQRFGE